MKVVLDTCVWSRFLRKNRPADDPINAEVHRLIKEADVQMIGAIRQELLSGVEPLERFEQLSRYLRFYPSHPLDEEDDELAAKFYNLCRARGVQGTGTDMLICAVASRNRWRIFTVDKDFERYAEHLPIRLHKT